MIAAALLLLTLPSPKLKFESSSIAPLYTTLRTLSLQEKGGDELGLSAGVNIFRELDKGLPDRMNRGARGERVAQSPEDRSVRDLYWTALDAFVLSSTDVQSLDVRKEQLADKVGGYLEIRPVIAKIVEALKVSQKAYESGQAEKDAKLVAESVKWWDDKVAAQSDKLYGWLESLMGIEDAPKEIRIIAVPRFPAQGAATFRTVEGPVVIVGCEKFQKADFAEALIHETIHAMEARAKKIELLGDLRAALREAKAEPFTEEQLPHTLFFMIAAEATRKFIDPDHQDVGQKIGTYKRGLEPFRAFGAPILKDLIDGKIDRHQAVAKLSAY